MSNKELAIKDLLYIHENGKIDDFLERGRVLKEAEQLGLKNLPNYVGLNSKKYLDLITEDWQKYI